MILFARVPNGCDMVAALMLFAQAGVHGAPPPWVAPPGAQGEGNASNRVLTASSSGRFLVSGPDSTTNMKFSRWAEGVADQFERFAGIRFPFRRGWAVEIRVVPGHEAADLAIVRDGEGFRRAITVGPWAAGDPERLDELLCRALAAGYLEDRRQRSGGGLLPEWLTMGMAQNLRMEQRLRNRTVLTAMRSESGTPGIADAMKWRTIPAGWPRHRAVCGMIVAWMGSYGEKGSPYARILDRLAEGGEVTPEWLAVEVTGSGSVQGMEAAWENWVGRQGNLVQTFGELSSDLISQLKLEIPLAAGAAVTGGCAVVLEPREAIRERAVPWVAQAALEKAQRLRVLTLGKAEELVAAGERFARFYEDLANGAPVLLLRYEIRRAEAELRELASLTRQREIYLDGIENELDRKTPWRVDNAESRMPVLEKGELERYVDRVEQKALDVQTPNPRELTP